MRLAKLYAVIENLHAMQVRAAAAAVAEIDQTALLVHKADQKDVTNASAGLREGSSMGALAVEQTAMAQRNRQLQLNQTRVQCADAHEAALAAHDTSRMELRQIERVFRHLETRRTIEVERRAQSESDDRFLAQRQWLRTTRSDLIE